MLKKYIYSDDEVGVPWPGPDADFILPDGRKKYDVEWPRFVWYALPGFEETDDPEQADIFVMRQRLIWVDDITRLPYLRGNEERHVFFDLGSDGASKCFRSFPGIPAIFLRAVCSDEMLERNPTTVAWPWPVDDMGKYVPLPEGGFRYDVVFQGQAYQVGNEGGRALLKSVRRAGLNVHIRETPSFYGTMPWGTVEKARLRQEFQESMSGARLSLCPISHAHKVIRYRFYEALSMGRVPVLFCDGCMPALADRIDYTRCIVRLDQCNVVNAGELLKDWLADHDDKEIVEMGSYGRAMWERWLKREHWAELVEMVVREKLGY